MKFPPKLKAGDRIEVVATSGPIEWAKPNKLKAAEDFFATHGIEVTYAKHLNGKGPLSVVPIEERIKDLDRALADSNVQAVWCLSGGENANQIIPFLDYELFQESNKIFIGHSDNAVLINAYSVKTGATAYYGPNFHALGSAKGSQITYDFLEKCLFSDEAYDLEPVKIWHDKDYSTKPPTDHTHRELKGWWPIQNANGAGTLVGGEISTFALLQGTKYFPNLKGKVLALEMYEGRLDVFDRLLESILLQKGAEKIEGIIIGRFQKQAGVNEDDLRYILREKQILQGVPIIANVDFGHTTPRLTLPIGGHVQLQISKSKQRIRIGEH